jgi:LacI family transcriptional regulator
LPTEYLLSLQNRNVPFVCVGESRPDKSLSVVDLDNVAAGYDATTHLLEAGHRRIALFSGDQNFLSSSQRMQGYKNALGDWGVAIDEALMLPGKYNTPSGYRRMRELLSAGGANLPTAIVCGDDWIALGAMQAVTEFGLIVPDDVSVIGINNNREGVASQPPLTTIDHPLRAIGQRAVDVVMEQVRNGVEPGEKCLLRGDLIIRSSICPPKSILRSGT